MQFLKKDVNKKIVKTILIILSISIFLKILYFINILGIYFGSFLREIEICFK